MKPTTRLLILIAVFIVTGALAIFQITENQTNSTLTSAKQIIAIADTSAIDRIAIVNTNGNLQLNRKENYWIVNDSFKARPQLINLLLFGLHELIIKRPAGKNKKEVYQQIASQGAQISIYSRSNKLDFKIASNPNDYNTAYYQQGADEPQIVYVPGVKGNLSSLLNFDSNEWRSKQLFNVNPTMINKIAVSYKDQQRQGFQIDISSSRPSIIGLTKPDQNKIDKFVNLFGILSVEAYLSKDSLEMLNDSEPDVIIDLHLDQIPAHRKLNVYYNQKQPSNLTGILKPSYEAVRLNAQIYKLVFVDKRFFEAK